MAKIKEAVMKQLSLLVLILIIIVSLISCDSQLIGDGTVKIQGFTVDSLTNNILDSVKISLYDTMSNANTTNLYTFSNDTGWYSLLEDNSVTTITVYAQKEGYFTNIVEILIEDKNKMVKNINFKLLEE